MYATQQNTIAITFEDGKTIVINEDIITIEELVDQWDLCDATCVIKDGVDITEECAEAFLDLINHDILGWDHQVSLVDNWDDLVADARQDADDWSRGAAYYYGVPSRL